MESGTHLGSPLVNRPQPSLTCPLCSSQYVRPRNLPCGHTFCEDCLAKFLHEKARQSTPRRRRRTNQIPCPSCRKLVDVPVMGVYGYPENLQATRVTEIIAEVTQNLGQSFNGERDNKRKDDVSTNDFKSTTSSDGEKSNGFTKDSVRSEERTSPLFRSSSFNKIGEPSPRRSGLSRSSSFNSRDILKPDKYQSNSATPDMGNDFFIKPDKGRTFERIYGSRRGGSMENLRDNSSDLLNHRPQPVKKEVNESEHPTFPWKTNSHKSSPTKPPVVIENVSRRFDTNLEVTIEDLSTSDESDSEYNVNLHIDTDDKHEDDKTDEEENIYKFEEYEIQNNKSNAKDTKEDVFSRPGFVKQQYEHQSPKEEEHHIWQKIEDPFPEMEHADRNDDDQYVDNTSTIADDVDSSQNNEVQGEDIKEDEITESLQRIYDVEQIWQQEKCEYAMPTSLVILTSGILVVADYGKCVLEMYNLEGTIIKTIENIKPFSLFSTDDDKFVVGDRKDKTLKIYDASGNIWDEWRKDTFKWIGGISMKNDGNYVIYERGDCKIGIYDVNEECLFSFGRFGERERELCMADFLTVDREDRIIVCDSGTHFVKVFNCEGQLLFKFGGRGTRDGLFAWPKGVAVDHAGNIIVTDQRNDRVCLFAPDGKFIQHLVKEWPRPYNVCYREVGGILGISNYSLNGHSKIALYKMTKIDNTKAEGQGDGDDKVIETTQEADTNTELKTEQQNDTHTPPQKSRTNSFIETQV